MGLTGWGSQGNDVVLVWGSQGNDVFLVWDSQCGTNRVTMCWCGTHGLTMYSWCGTHTG